MLLYRTVLERLGAERIQVGHTLRSFESTDTTPFLDGRCLADCLERFKEPLHALREYEAARLPRTAAIVLRNRLNGPEQVMQLAHERAPDGFANIDAVIPRKELEEIAIGYKKLAGFEPASVNANSAQVDISYFA